MPRCPLPTQTMTLKQTQTRPSDIHQATGYPNNLETDRNILTGGQDTDLAGRLKATAAARRPLELGASLSQRSLAGEAGLLDGGGVVVAHAQRHVAL